MDSNMPMPKPAPKPAHEIDDQEKDDLVSFTTPELEDARRETTRLLDRDEIAVSKPVHGETYSSARKLVQGASKACDTRPGVAAQLLVPAVAAGCATAHTLDKLDQAYDAHLMGDSKGTTDKLAQAAHEAVGGIGGKHHKAAVSLVEAARVHANGAGDGPTTGDHLRTAALSAIGVAAGGKFADVVEPALAAGDAWRRSDVDATNDGANTTLAAGVGLIAKTAAGKVGGGAMSRIVGDGADVLAEVALPKVEILSKEKEGGEDSPNPLGPSTAFLSFLARPAPAPRQVKLPTPYDEYQ